MLAGGLGPGPPGLPLNPVLAERTYLHLSLLSGLLVSTYPTAEHMHHARRRQTLFNPILDRAQVCIGESSKI